LFAFAKITEDILVKNCWNKLQHSFFGRHQQYTQLWQRKRAMLKLCNHWLCLHNAAIAQLRLGIGLQIYYFFVNEREIICAWNIDRILSEYPTAVWFADM